MKLAIFMLFASICCSQVEKHVFSCDEIEREYFIYLPQNFNSLSKVPAVLYFHGYGSSAESEMEIKIKMHAIADSVGFVVVYPNAIEGKWKSGLESNPFFPVPNVNDVKFVDTLLDTLGVKFNVDMRRVYATGHSNGGFMCFKIAIELGNRVAAIAPISCVLRVDTEINS